MSEQMLSVPVDVEKSEISSILNAAILLAFLMGMYTTVYFGTMYLYFTKNSTNRRLVPAVVTILFLTSIIQTGFQWYSIKWVFIDNGDTRDSVFVAIFSGPEWVTLAGLILVLIGFVLADGLLIWRCYFVWNRSIRIISVPLFLLLTEAGLFSVQIVFNARTNEITSTSEAALINDLLSAAYFISFGTSILTTTLIAYKIYSVLKQEGTSTRRFKNVLNIVVQSGAVYSLTLFVTAISGVLPGSGALLDTRTFAFVQYAQELLISVAGMSTTLLVACVAMLAPDTTFPSTSIHVSGLQFHAQPTHQTDTPGEIDATHSMNIDTNSEAQEEKVQ